MSDNKLGAGTKVTGQYKRAGRESVQAAVEVTAVLALPTERGSISFGYPERVAAKDLEWALEEGA